MSRTNSEETKPRDFKEPIKHYFGPIVAILALSGCSVNNNPNSTNNATSEVPTTAIQYATTTTTAPYNRLPYDTNYSRVTTIENATQAFGKIVLSQYDNHNGSWTPYDTYCFTPNSQAGGWASQGYKPKNGQECYVQLHFPNNGQVSVDVQVGNNGEYTNIVGVGVVSPECSAEIRDQQIDGQQAPEVMVGTPATGLEDSNLANSLQEAEAIDNKAISCFSNTRP